MARFHAWCACLALAGCVADLEVPDSVTVTCGVGVPCPAGRVCNVTSGVCVGVDRADQEAPGVAGQARFTPRVGRLHSVVQVAFVPTEDLSRLPVVWTRFPAARRDWRFVGDAGGRYTFELTLDGSEAEGPAEVRTELVDVAGNPSTALLLGEVVVDFQAPQLVTDGVTLAYVPGQDNRLARVGALRTGSSVTLSLTANEPLSRSPAISTAGQPLCASAVLAEPSSSTTCTYLLDSATTPPDGAHPLVATLTDVAGNEVTVPLPKPLEIDRVAPSAAALVVRSQLLHLRVPGGNRLYDGARQFLTRTDLAPGERADARPLPAEAFSPDVEGVAIYEEEAGGALVGLTTRTTEGLPSARLSGPDRLSIWVAVLDRAGNESSDRVRVNQGEWALSSSSPVHSRATVLTPSLATLPSGPAPRLLLAHPFTPPPVHARGGGAWTRTGPFADPPAHSGHALIPDGSGLLLFGLVGEEGGWKATHGRWQRRAFVDTDGDGQPVSRTDFGLSGAGVLYGGRGAAGPLADTWKVKDGNWTRFTPTDPEHDGNPSARWSFALETASDKSETLLFGGTDPSNPRLGDTWRFDTRSWRLVTATDPEGDGNPTPRHSARLTWNLRAKEFVLFGGQASAGPSGETWIWVRATSSWKRVVPVDPEGDGDPPPALRTPSAGRNFRTRCSSSAVRAQTGC